MDSAPGAQDLHPAGRPAPSPGFPPAARGLCGNRRATPGQSGGGRGAAWRGASGMPSSRWGSGASPVSTTAMGRSPDMPIGPGGKAVPGCFFAAPPGCGGHPSCCRTVAPAPPVARRPLSTVPQHGDSGGGLAVSPLPPCGQSGYPPPAANTEGSTSFFLPAGSFTSHPQGHGPIRYAVGAHAKGALQKSSFRASIPFRWGVRFSPACTPAHKGIPPEGRRSGAPPFPWRKRRVDGDHPALLLL